MKSNSLHHQLDVNCLSQWKSRLDQGMQALGEDRDWQKDDMIRTLSSHLQTDLAETIRANVYSSKNQCSKIMHFRDIQAKLLEFAFQFKTAVSVDRKEEKLGAPRLVIFC